VPVTEEDLDLLLELSDVDAHIARIAATLADLPEQAAVDAALARRVELEQEGDALRVDLDQVASELRRREREVDQLRQRLDAERSRLYGGSITNAREMQSAEAEIESTQVRIDEHEEQMLASMERSDELDAAIEERARGVEQTQAETARLEEVRDEAAQHHLSEKAELEVSRDELRGKLSAEPLAAYDGMRERFRVGVAVGELNGTACSACRIDFSRADLNELKDGPPLATCPSCRRLLVVRT